MTLSLLELEGRAVPAYGDLDLAFGTAGRVDLTPIDSFVDAELMPDGRLVVAGFQTLPDLTQIPKVLRLNVDGSLDSTFGTAGVAILESNFVPRELDLRADGGIVLGGTAQDIRIVSLTPSGAFDPAFGSNGTVNFSWAVVGSGSVTDLESRADGSLLVAGRVVDTGPTGPTSALVAARFLPNGNFDTSFAGGGRILVPPVASGTFSLPEAQIAPDGRIIAMLVVSAPLPPPAPPGDAQPVFSELVTLTRYTTSGVVDSTFGNSGTTIVGTFTSTTLTTRRVNLTVTDDNHYYVSSREFVAATINNELLYRFQSDGTLDVIFGNSGVVTGFNSGLIASQPDGRFLTATVIDPNQENAGRLFAFTATGAVDASFGTGGFVSGETIGLIPGGPNAPAEVLTTRNGGAIFIAQSLNTAPTPVFAYRLQGVPRPAPNPAGLPNVVAVGLGTGGAPTVQLRGPAGQLFDSFTPITENPGGARTASIDFTGDRVVDVAIGTGPGRNTRVVLLDGVTGATLFDVAPFEASFTGGVFVSAGDVDGDGVPDLAISPDEGGGPRVDIYSGGKGFAKFASFFGIDDVNFRGGARTAIGDLNADGRNDLVVAAGFGGGPRVAAFNGLSLDSTPTRLFGDFFAFEQTLRNGVYVTVGDLNGDGFAELVAGGGPGGGPRVLAFDGKSLLTNQYVPRANFFGGDPNSRGGIRIAAKDLDGDNRADLVVGSGEGAGSRLTAYLATSIAPSGTPPAAFDFDTYPGFAGGIFVG